MWKHYIKQEHSPEMFIDAKEAVCVCGKRIVNVKKGVWLER